MIEAWLFLRAQTTQALSRIFPLFSNMDAITYAVVLHFVLTKECTMIMGNKMSYKQLKKAYLQAAKIVVLHGEKYLPIFERLENEHKAKKTSQHFKQSNQTCKIRYRDRFKLR